MEAGLNLGAISTPKQGNVIPDTPWCADNGCFSANTKVPFDIHRWFDWLTKKRPRASSCLFATAPDVVGDAVATLKRSRPWLPMIRQLGFPAALVAQDGLENLEVPWDEFDCLFIGGTTDWKLSEHAMLLIKEARDRGKWVHMGRVNSYKRYRIARLAGCHSVDGTYLAFGPDVNLPKLLGWAKKFEKEFPNETQ